MNKIKYMRIMLAMLLMIMLILNIPLIGQAAGSGVSAYLKMALSTRTGPGTWYDEEGTFFQSSYNSTTVRVLTKAWDNRNSIWWLQVEFYRNNTPHRAYTGLKRVDVDLDEVIEESILGTATTKRSATGYWGPGRDYAASKYDIPANVEVTVLDVENNYAQIEFYDSRTADRDYARRRAWIKTEYITGNWSNIDYNTNPTWSSENVTNDDWKKAYKDFLDDGSYDSYLHAANPEYADMFYYRDKQWDAYTTYDLNLDSIPELLIRTDYAIEQVDVFTYNNGIILWMGTMGGDNFFQTILSYDGAGIRGKLYTFVGGPAMQISEYQMTEAGLKKRSIGYSQVDSEGQKTVGLIMYESDNYLEQLLRGTLLQMDCGEHLNWVNRKNVESNWNQVFSAPRNLGIWN